MNEQTLIPLIKDKIRGLNPREVSVDRRVIKNGVEIIYRLGDFALERYLGFEDENEDNFVETYHLVAFDEDEYEISQQSYESLERFVQQEFKVTPFADRNLNRLLNHLKTDKYELKGV